MDAALDRLLNLLWTYTNRGEIDEAAYPESAVCYLDFGSLNRDALQSLGTQLVSEVGQALQMNGTVGVASGKFPAYLAAMTATPVTLVLSGHESAFVAPFPIDLLPMSKDAARLLRLFSIRTLGDLARFSRAAVVAQFGKPGRQMHLLANGYDGRHLKLRRIPASELVSARFDEPVETQHRLDVHLHRLTAQMEERLNAGHSAVHAVSLTVIFASGRAQREALRLLQPRASATGSLGTVQQLLARIPLTEGIARIEIEATHLVPDIPRQMELFTHKPEKQQLIDLLEVLMAKHGVQAFYRPVVDNPNSLLPERRFTLRRVDTS